MGIQFLHGGAGLGSLARAICLARAAGSGTLQAVRRLWLLLLGLLVGWPPAALGQQLGSSGGAGGLRIESEDKLSVPQGRSEEVWRYLMQRLAGDEQFIASLDPQLKPTVSEEYFVDTYFDTPRFDFLRLRHGVRYRRRVNLTDPDDVKSGRELVQIKLNDISDNPLARAEYKFDVTTQAAIRDADDLHPVIGLVRKGQRADFQRRITELGLDPYALRPVLTLQQRRRRVYLTRGEAVVMTISLDDVTSRLYWATAGFTELEPEINEILYTGADGETRRFLEELQARVVTDIQGAFPDIRRDLTPKYNKAFYQFEKQLPFLRAGLTFGYEKLVAVPLLPAAAAGGAAAWWLRRRRRGRFSQEWAAARGGEDS